MGRLSTYFLPQFPFQIESPDWCEEKQRPGLDLKQDGDPEMTALLKAFRFHFLSMQTTALETKLLSFRKKSN